MAAAGEQSGQTGKSLAIEAIPAGAIGEFKGVKRNGGYSKKIKLIASGDRVIRQLN